MEIDAFIRKMKDINSALIDFIEAPKDYDADFIKLIDIFEKHKILESQDAIQALFRLISIMADDYHRSPDFFDKVEKIFLYLFRDIPSTVSNLIPDYTIFNKRIVFLLIDKGFAKPDEKFIKQYLQSKKAYKKTRNKKNLNIMQTYYFLYPKIKEFLEGKVQKKIEEEIFQNYKIAVTEFEEKCQVGENDSYVCSLLRSDSVEKFISYVNETNMSLLSRILSSIYETHTFLIDKEPTLIEYAAFFGSIQIIQYLKFNNVPLTPSLWQYAIHSNNIELIRFLAENGVKPENKNVKSAFGFTYNSNFKNPFDIIMIESIKCHHNAVSNYIKDNFYEKVDDNNSFYEKFTDTIVDSLNFFFFPNEVESIICKQKNLSGFKLSQLCFSLTQITIPSSVTSIGKDAFSKCSSLTKILIPSSVTSIGDNAFSGCTSLAQISIPSSITSIGNNIFEGIKTLEITGDTKHIPKNFFSKCSKLTQITIPSSVTSIGENSFYYCTLLKEITIPSSVTSIGDRAFYFCSSLKQITIPSSVISIGNYSFTKCSILTQLKFEAPSSVTSIGDYAFSECSKLPEIEIPSSITSIGNNVFHRCPALAQITIPSSVTEIGNHACAECMKLNQIEIPSSVTKIGNNVFHRCSSLAQITIPSSVTEIGNYTFAECSKLAQIEIPSSVTKIGNYAFYRCSLLTQITIPSSVTSIGDYAFSGCLILAQITIPSSVISFGNYAFFGCSKLTQMTIPSKLTSIENNVFTGCIKLTQISIPSSVTSIGKSAFEGCSSLEQVTFDNSSSLTSIGDNAFFGCSSLAQITIPSSVTSIGNNTFSKCSSLKQITIPSSVTSIGNNAFDRCTSLVQITIPSSVTSIGDNAFKDCSKLAETTIPSSVTSIGNNTFFGCSSLNQISIPSSVTSIGDNAFTRCSKLAQITIPSSVTSIGHNAFYKCSSLTQVTIPSSITSIGNSAFSECSSLSAESIESIESIMSTLKKNNTGSAWAKGNNKLITNNWSKYNKNSDKKEPNNDATSKNKYTWGQGTGNKNGWKSTDSSSLKNKYSPYNNKQKSTTNTGTSVFTWGRKNDNKSGWQTVNKDLTYNKQITSSKPSWWSGPDKKVNWQSYHINNSAPEEKDTKKIMSEFEIAKMLDHPNVLKALNVTCDDNKVLSIQFEESSTDLKCVIEKKIMSNVQLVCSIFQIAEGMKYIHSRKIVHLNLKPSNILISDDGTIKISDFEKAEKVASENESGEMNDVYSFGEIVYFILSGREINNSEKEKVIESFPLLAQQLIEACLYDDLECRPTFEMICDILEKNNFNLIALSQQEVEDVSKLASLYRQNSTH